MVKSLVLISLGAAFGAALRYLAYLGFSSFPGYLPTFIVNILGSLALGGFTVWLRDQVHPDWAAPLSLLLLTGFLGSFTTFSTMSGDLFKLLETQWIKGLGVALAQVSLGVISYYLGLKFGLLLSKT